MIKYVTDLDQKTKESVTKAILSQIDVDVVMIGANSFKLENLRINGSGTVNPTDVPISAPKTNEKIKIKFKGQPFPVTDDTLANIIDLVTRNLSIELNQLENGEAYIAGVSLSDELRNAIGVIQDWVVEEEFNKKQTILALRDLLLRYHTLEETQVIAEKTVKNIHIEEPLPDSFAFFPTAGQELLHVHSEANADAPVRKVSKQIIDTINLLFDDREVSWDMKPNSPTDTTSGLRAQIRDEYKRRFWQVNPTAGKEYFEKYMDSVDTLIVAMFSSLDATLLN